MRTVRECVSPRARRSTSTGAPEAKFNRATSAAERAGPPAGVIVQRWAQGIRYGEPARPQHVRGVSVDICVGHISTVHPWACRARAWRP